MGDEACGGAAVGTAINGVDDEVIMHTSGAYDAHLLVPVVPE